MEKQKKKRKQSPEVLARHNHKTEVKKMMQIVSDNFGENDVFMSLIVRAESRAKRDDRKELRKFIRKCADEHNQRGKQFRYLYTMDSIETGKHKRDIVVRILVDGSFDCGWYQAVAQETYDSVTAIPTNSRFFSFDAFEKYLKRKADRENKARRWACSRNLKRKKQ